jgi:hypothetical protein
MSFGLRRLPLFTDFRTLPFFTLFTTDLRTLPLLIVLLRFVNARTAESFLLAPTFFFLRDSLAFETPGGSATFEDERFEDFLEAIIFDDLRAATIFEDFFLRLVFELFLFDDFLGFMSSATWPPFPPSSSLPSLVLESSSLDFFLP